MNLRRNTPQAPRARRGFTLIEMIIAIIVMSIGIMGLAGTATYVAQQMGGGNAQTIAAALSNKVADSLASRRCSALVSGSMTKRGVKITWEVTDSSRTKWVTEQAQYTTKSGNTKRFNYTSVVQCPD